jgi:antitoxin HigA-1
MATRLSIAFNTTAESWLLQQLQYDLAQAEPKRKSFKLKGSKQLDFLHS